MSNLFTWTTEKFRKNTIIPIFLIVFLVCSFFIDKFFSLGNFVNILGQNAEKGILAAGMTFVILNGYFDLSVGTLMGLTSCLTVGLTPVIGLIPSILLALCLGAAVGLINGLLVTKLKINAFIVTLAGMTIFRGITYMYTQQTVRGSSKAFYELSRGSFLGLPNPVWLCLAFILLGQAVLYFTRHGRNTYAAGGNMSSAQNAGINVDRTVILNFVICSFCAAVAGVMYASKFNSASPTLGWPDAHMLAIAAVVLGGTKLSGGDGNMFYTLGGLCTLGMINNAMNLLKLSSYYNTLVMGIILIIVLYMDIVLREQSVPSKRANIPGAPKKLQKE